MLDIYLKPEEIHNFCNRKVAGEWHLTPEFVDAVAKASADNAVKVILEDIERHIFIEEAGLVKVKVLAKELTAYWQELKQLADKSREG